MNFVGEGAKDDSSFLLVCALLHISEDYVVDTVVHNLLEKILSKDILVKMVRNRLLMMYEHTWSNLLPDLAPFANDTSSRGLMPSFRNRSRRLAILFVSTATVMCPTWISSSRWTEGMPLIRCKSRLPNVSQAPCLKRWEALNFGHQFIFVKPNLSKSGRLTCSMPMMSV